MKNTLKNLFRSPFNLEEYTRIILSGLLHAQRINARPELLEETSDGDIVYGLGILEDAERKRIGLFYTEVRHSDVTRKRVGLRRVVEPYIKANVDAALAVFDDGRHWRLSYICDLREGSTLAKRFSYILGDENGQYKTPLERLEKVAKLSGRLRLSDLRESFSVDALSDEFFDEYHIHYDRIVANLTQSYRSDAMHGVSADSVSTTRLHDYVKKMMGRIVFLHFLQKKGWLCGDPDFMRNTFRRCARQEDYLESVLEPLFFGMLNTEPEHREEVFRNHHWDIDLLHQWQPAQNNSSSLISNSSLNSIPYLNGGLFEEDEVDRLRVRLPDSLFRELFDFLASYNFTVDENDPDDAEIGVDPEMLGKIFESLLEDNKAKGAFYTPKEIVRYMCKESLIAYLGAICFPADGKTGNTCVTADGKNTDCGDAVGSLIRTFVETHEFPSELEPYRDVLDRALREVKICDPAIGSGAFPMGLLNELWRCREAISSKSTSLSSLEESKLSVTPYKAAGRSVVTEAAGRSVVTGTNSVENTRLLTRLELKKQIIENNIYGVDIERGAIDIARLRFWLSIVVDSDEPAPLPNFDYKFMQGNSLIESFEGVDLSRMMDGGARSSLGRGKGKAGENQLAMEYSTDDTKRNLQLMLKEYFSLTDHREKAAARASINESVKSYIRQQGLHPSAEARLAALDPSANQEFFLWHTWFKDIFDRGGFDIVVGNPPYIRQESLGMDYKSLLIAAYPEVGNGIADIFVYFFGLAIKIMSSKGVLAYITSNKYLKTKYGRDLRNTLSTKVTVDRIIDFFELPVFNASTDAGITILYKSIKESPTRYYPVKTLENLDLGVLTSGHYLTTIKNASEWQFVNQMGELILKKINTNSTTLLEFTKNRIYRGITTGLNDAFVVKNRVIAEELLKSESGSLIKKYAQPTDIQKWKINNDDKYFIIGTFPAIHVDIDDYPTLRNYLASFGVERLEQTGKTYFVDGELVKSRKKTNNEWFETQDSVAYYKEFEKNKIIYIHTAKEHKFFFDTKGFYINNSCYMIISDSKFLFFFLNSSLFKYYKQLKFVAYGDGQEAGRCKLDYNKMITVPIKKNVDETPFEKMYEKILSIKQNNPDADTTLLEREIEQHIYDLYNLTPEEIAVVEGNNI